MPAATPATTAALPTTAAAAESSAATSAGAGWAKARISVIALHPCGAAVTNTAECAPVAPG